VSLPMILDEARALFARTLSLAEPVNEYNADVDDFFRPAMESEGTTALSRQALESRGTAPRRPLDSFFDEDATVASARGIQMNGGERGLSAMPHTLDMGRLQTSPVPIHDMLPKSDGESVDEEDDEYQEYRRGEVRGPAGEGSIYEEDWDVFLDEEEGKGDAGENFQEEDFDDGDMWICHSKAL